MEKKDIYQALDNRFRGRMFTEREKKIIDEIFFVIREIL